MTRRNAGSRSQTRTAKRRTPQARREDKYDLYQRAVQEPDPDIAFLQRVFKHHYGRPARLLREDFGGTGYLSTEWVRKHADNRAWAIDLDPEPLKWGREHNQASLPAARRDHLQLVEGDVRTTQTPPADVTVAFNFSYMLFKRRQEMLLYLRKARSSLRREGLLVLDVYGGRDAQKRQIETRGHDGFDYQWDQDRFDPITHEAVNYIHFKFRDGSRMVRAFRYEWRLWMLPELRELLREAGFSETHVYWEGTDRKTNEGNGVFTRREHALDDPAWIAYLVAPR